jgi:hypothetical protein
VAAVVLLAISVAWCHFWHGWLLVLVFDVVGWHCDFLLLSGTLVGLWSVHFPGFRADE